MSRLVVIDHLTLDGVMQAPGHREEDRDGGFAHGGWAAAYSDEVMGEYMGRDAGREGALLFGRRTYEIFAGIWPHQPDDAPFAALLNQRRKYVASRTLREPLEWQNSTLLEGDAADAVARLKAQEDGPDLAVLGSGGLVQSLLAAGLVDELILTIHPLVLGTGRRLFPDGGVPARFELLETLPTTTGVIIARYRPAAS